jgi:hypothetical protein
MITLPRFDRIPFLVHGFGDRALTAADLRSGEPWRHFHAVSLRQVHSDTVHVVERAPRQSLLGDALVTGQAGLLLIIKSADCLPVLIVDADRRTVAAVHCGWRGTLAGVLERTVNVMRERCGTAPGSILAGLGPCIGAACYEVGEDVRGRFAQAGLPQRLFRPAPDRPGKFLFDLAGANRLQLLHAGVREENIFAAGPCTHCDPRLPSYRRDRQRAGRLLSFIGVTPGK